MGQYGNQPDFGTSAVVATKSDLVGTSTNLNSSIFYVGTAGDVRAIIAGNTYDLTITTPSSTITTDGEFTFQVPASAGVTTSGNGGNAEVTLTVAGGIVTKVNIVNPGNNFTIADTMTFSSVAFPGAATSVVLTVATTSGILFKNIPNGTFLTVVCDYLLSTGTTASDIVAVK